MPDSIVEHLLIANDTSLVPGLNEHQLAMMQALVQFQDVRRVCGEGLGENDPFEHLCIIVLDASELAVRKLADGELGRNRDVAGRSWDVDGGR